MSVVETPNQTNYNKILKELKCDYVFILHGDDDKLVSNRECKSIFKIFNQNLNLKVKKLIKIKHCGHIPHEELPIKFVSIIEIYNK